MTRGARTGRVRRAAPHLRDVETLCLEVLKVPGMPMVCELTAGHLATGVQHQSGCTHWGRPNSTEESG